MAMLMEGGRVIVLDAFEITLIRQVDEIERRNEARYSAAMLYARTDMGNEAFYLFVACIRGRCWSLIQSPRQSVTLIDVEDGVPLEERYLFLGFFAGLIYGLLRIFRSVHNTCGLLSLLDMPAEFFGLPIRKPG